MAQKHRAAAEAAKPHLPDKRRSAARERKRIAPETGRQHYATFTVRLTLDERNSIHKTHIEYVKSGEKADWADWNEASLLDFIKQHSALRLQPPPVVSPAPPPEPAEPAELISLSDLQAILAEAETPSHLLAAGQPFRVRAYLTIPKAALPYKAPLECRVTFQAKGVGGERLTIGEVQADVSATADTTLVTTKSITLPAGLYRLSAMAVMGRRDKRSLGHSNAMAYAAGGLLQVG